MQDTEIVLQFWDEEIDQDFWKLANEFEGLMTKKDVFEVKDILMTKTEVPEEVFFLDQTPRTKTENAETPEQTTGDWKNEPLSDREEMLSHASEKVVAEKVPQAHAEIKNEFRNARVRPPKEISQDEYARRRLRAQMESGFHRWTREDYEDYYQNGPTKAMKPTKWPT